MSRRPVAAYTTGRVCWRGRPRPWSWPLRCAFRHLARDYPQRATLCTILVMIYVAMTILNTVVRMTKITVVRVAMAITIRVI